MAFWKKNDERRKRELEGIKSRVEGKKPPLMSPPTGDWSVKQETGTPKIDIPDVNVTPVETPPKPRFTPKISIPPLDTSPEPGAPLFIKIEKYEGVIDMLQEMKNTLQTLTRLISFHSEVDELKGVIFIRIKDTVSSITDSLISMDEVFIKPERPDITESGKTKDEKDAEEQILDLGEELRHLKRELTKIE